MEKSLGDRALPCLTPMRLVSASEIASGRKLFISSASFLLVKVLTSLGQRDLWLGLGLDLRLVTFKQL
ncbi:hypothetical protein BpHYR1_044524 [Brachionus plicatilis]|uniref:Uncharacterized protein n=1 Tax=Brachionus plicatilis TaxID=10195 RepID=A0A3M7SYV2_BRAPC|nr:hypothetical protein BpHYR1_044524 [Brachionus plicatilis]